MSRDIHITYGVIVVLLILGTCGVLTGVCQFGTFVGPVVGR